MILVHSGYREQPRKVPKRPRFSDIGAPHSGQTGASSSFGSSPASPRERLPRHSGNPSQPRNFSPPDQRRTSGRPQRSQGSAVGSPLIRGISTTAFDGRGNYPLGLKEHVVFPEIDYAKVASMKGMNITIVTTARTDPESLSLLRHMGMPFGN